MSDTDPNTPSEHPAIQEDREANKDLAEHPALAADRAMSAELGHDPASQLGRTDDPMPAAPTKAQRIDNVIESWVRQHIHNSPVAQNVAAYSWLKSKLVHLRDAIMKGE